MGRSPGFASAPADKIRPVKARFRSASPAERVVQAGGAQLVGSLCKRHAVTPILHRGSGSLWAHGFRFFSLRSVRSFSPFPHGTRALSVPQWYLALPDGAGWFGQGFSGPALLRVPANWLPVRVRGCHPLRRRFPNAFHFGPPALCRPYNPGGHAPRFGLARFRSPLLAGSLVCFPFLRVLRCFSSPGRRPDQVGTPCLQHGGLPHSDTCGSMAVCASPQLFAACRVLRRPWGPGHPPCALACFLSLRPRGTCPGRRRRTAPGGADVRPAMCGAPGTGGRTVLPFRCLVNELLRRRPPKERAERRHGGHRRAEPAPVAPGRACPGQKKTPPGKAWRIPDSNRWPLGCKPSALAS